ncbi:Panacea domain-containing protein [Luteimonas soli]|uniref:Panacea domain-containing protein n=1 Tax=Luteimonas soli TaxID=1648966 RepID=A0ABV7XPR3_9GAMM
MATVHDVAAFILERAGSMSTMKLQKLVYYSQAWSLVWDGDVLFDSQIQAWANGPVCPELFQSHRGAYRVAREDISGDPNQLNQDQRETVEGVLSVYGDKTPQWLSDLTHVEDPWKLARAGVPEGANCSSEISRESMLNYYSSL